ncbi:MAG TPA: hypothetical protein PLB91_10440 [Spirochaetales bacterium]|nr:hypothetical protein [Spirochaetales bacterium]HRY53587.1 hypothetical protein [Spirochaetia bacterium]HRZ63888.1 hypothetical protein [Spirochaetia bacterium]
MRGARALRKLLFLAPLSAAALLAAALPGGPGGAGLSFAAIAAYVRVCAQFAGASGGEEALLFAEALPFLAFCLARFARGGPAGALLAAAEAVAILAALLLAEAAARAERRPLAAAFLFVALAAAGGAALELARPATLLGAALLLALVAGYVLARRER